MGQRKVKPLLDQVQRYASDLGVQFAELPEPEISHPYQLLIAVHAAGVGNWDDLVRTGSWDMGGTPPPLRLTSR